MKPPTTERKIAGDKAVVTAEGGKVVSQKVETRAAKRTKEGWNVVPSDERPTKKALPPKMAEVSVKQTSANVQKTLSSTTSPSRKGQTGQVEFQGKFVAPLLTSYGGRTVYSILSFGSISPSVKPTMEVT